MDERLVGEVLDDQSGGSKRKLPIALLDWVEADTASTYVGLLWEIVFSVSVYSVGALSLIYSANPSVVSSPSLLSNVVQMGIFVSLIVLLYRSQYARRWHKLIYGVAYGLFGLGILLLLSPRVYVTASFHIAIDIWLVIFSIFSFYRSVGILYSHYRSGPPVLHSILE